MAGSFRRLWERIAYAGLKPTTPGTKPQRASSGRWWDRLLTGSTPDDPLYLSNRTWKQRLRLGLLVSAPIIMVLGTVAYNVFAPPPQADKPPEFLTPAEIAARSPILPKDFSVPQNTDLQIVEATVEHTAAGSFISGMLRNTSRVRYGGAELVFDLADNDGSQVGAAMTRVGTIDPKGQVRFRFEIPHRRAATALVREVHGSFNP